MFYSVFYKEIVRRHNKKIIANTKQVRAKILRVNLQVKNLLILELLINNEGKEYVTSYLIHNPDKKQRKTYISGGYVFVHINKKDPNDVVIPDIVYYSSIMKELGWVKILQKKGIIIFNLLIVGSIEKL